MCHYFHEAVNARRRGYLDGSKYRMEACGTLVAVVADTGAVVIFMAFGVRMSKSHLGFMVESNFGL